jgi:hypothetical protein
MIGTIGTLPDIVALRGLAETPVPDAIFIAGYSEPADGGEGMFYNSGAAAGGDNGGTVIVDAANRVWLREASGAPYNARWFGAKGNGATDDTVAIQRAIDAVQTETAPHRPSLVLPAGIYATSSPLVIRGTTKLTGEGRFNTYIVASDLFADVILVSGDPAIDLCPIVEISNLALHATAPKTAGYGIRITAAGGCSCERHCYRNICFSRNMFGGLHIGAGLDLNLDNITVMNVGKNSQGFLFRGTSDRPVSRVQMTNCHVELSVTVRQES